MYFSSKLVKDLLIELANFEELDPDSVHNLIYHLNLPGSAVPSFIAKEIAECPSLSSNNSRLPGRLAFGIVDNSLVFFDVSKRYEQQSRLCRQVSRIKLGLEKLEHPVHVIDTFDNRLSLMVFASAAASDLAAEEREISNAEKAILSERIIESLLFNCDLTQRLLERIVGNLQRTEKNRLKLRIGETIQEGIQNPPWDNSDDAELIFDLNKPVRFRAALVENQHFGEAAQKTIDCINELCRQQ